MQENMNIVKSIINNPLQNKEKESNNSFNKNSLNNNKQGIINTKPGGGQYENSSSLENKLPAKGFDDKPDKEELGFAASRRKKNNPNNNSIFSKNDNFNNPNIGLGGSYTNKVNFSNGGSNSTNNTNFNSNNSMNNNSDQRNSSEKNSDKDKDDNALIKNRVKKSFNNEMNENSKLRNLLILNLDSFEKNEKEKGNDLQKFLDSKIPNTIKQTKNFDKQIEEELKTLSSHTPFQTKNNNSIFAESQKSPIFFEYESRRKKNAQMFLVPNTNKEDFGKSPRIKENIDPFNKEPTIHSNSKFSALINNNTSNNNSSINKFSGFQVESSGPSVFGKESRRANKINEPNFTQYNESFKPQISRRNFLENK